MKKPGKQYADTQYDVITYGEGKPIIGRAESAFLDEIRVYLWLQPLDGVFYLRPKKPEVE